MNCGVIREDDGAAIHRLYFFAIEMGQDFLPLRHNGHGLRNLADIKIESRRLSDICVRHSHYDWRADLRRSNGSYRSGSNPCALFGLYFFQLPLRDFGSVLQGTGLLPHLGQGLGGGLGLGAGRARLDLDLSELGVKFVSLSLRLVSEVRKVGDRLFQVTGITRNATGRYADGDRSKSRDGCCDSSKGGYPFWRVQLWKYVAAALMMVVAYVCGLICYFWVLFCAVAIHASPSARMNYALRFAIGGALAVASFCFVYQAVMLAAF